MKIREKLKSSQMRLVELANYLEISRPTLYRYLELYENKEYNEIDKKCLDLFSFIDNQKNIQRHVIMDYIINKVIPVEDIINSDVEIISIVRKLTESPVQKDKKKLTLIWKIASSNVYDDILDMLIDAESNNSWEFSQKVKKNTKVGED
ncbi:MAG: hypothetical protein RBT45_03405 [Acholeplasmataceae bacterium]|nr:hypothetical protein [Acholeplasmataceae bacterium]